MGTVELKTTLAQISSPPWAVDPDTREGMEWNIHIIDYDFNRVCFSSNPGGNSVKTTEANARLIAMAPDLAAEVLRLRAEVERLTEALRSIADAVPHYDYVRVGPGGVDLSDPGSPYDRGKADGFALLQPIARAALKEKEA